MYNSIENFMVEAKAKTEIHPTRKKLIEEAALTILEHLKSNKSLTLVYVCTHNSRRSQFCQVWSAVLTEKYGFGDKLESDSAGTEVTACNPRTVASLKRSGFEVETFDTSENPVYVCTYGKEAPEIKLWSKTLDDPSIKKPLIAIMTCSDADENCPFVPGALARIRLMYEDPKVSDDTPDEAHTYDARSAQIAAELSFLYERLALSLG